MKKLILLILLIPSLLFAGPLQQAHKKVIASLTGADEGEVTYLINQNFETDTTGYDNSETWTEIGTYIDPAYTTAPLLGDQSCILGQTDGNGTGWIISPDFSPTTGEVYGHLRFKLVGTFASLDNFLQTRTSAGSTSGMFQLYVGSDGRIGTTCGGFSFTSTYLSEDTEYHIWWRFKPGDGDGECEVWIGTSTTRPASSDQERTSLTADGSLTDMDIYLKPLGMASAYVVVDQIKIADVEFTTVD